MVQSKEVNINEIEDLLTEMNGNPKDLWNKSTEGNGYPIELAKETEDTGDVELNLELSLGGSFGADPKESNVIGSSSVASQPFAAPSVNMIDPMPISLPTEEEKNEWRRELNALWKVEETRKRSEELRNFWAAATAAAAAAASSSSDGLAAMNLMRKVDSSNSLLGAWSGGGGAAAQPRMVPWADMPFGLPYWDPAFRGGRAAAALSRGMDASLMGRANVLGGGDLLRGFPPLLSQGSLGSQGSSSTVISDYENELFQGLGNCIEPKSAWLNAEKSEENAMVAPISTFIEKSGMPTKVGVEKQSKKPKVTANSIRDVGRKVIEEVPCVSTKGDGPNGTTIEGFLYQYSDDEEMRIVCVCHGNTFSPAEFIKHAGGSEVAHPLKHIIIKPSSSLI